MRIAVINDVLNYLVNSIHESTKQVGNDEWELNGKKGKWREAIGRHVFFPNDGGDPVGIPGAAKDAEDSDSEAQLDKIGSDRGKRRKAFGKASGKIGKAVAGVGAKVAEDMDSEDESTLEDIENGSASSKAVSILASKSVRRAMMAGIGVAIGLAFPTLIGYAAMYMIGKMATGLIKQRLGFRGENESKTSRKEEFANIVETSFKEAIDKFSIGDIENDMLKKSISFAKKKHSDAK